MAPTPRSLLVVFLSTIPVVFCTSLHSKPLNLTEGQINAVTDCLTEAAQQSWELGTRAQAILELYVPSYSVFSPNLLPPPPLLPSNLSDALSPLFSIAHNVVANRPVSNGNITGPQPLISDSSAGDPASLGVAVLLSNWTGRSAVDGLNYSGAATDQLKFLYQNVPKTPDGAISHRIDEVELWSDFVYMVPPFLAYYGVITKNRSLLTDAFNQIRLYRNYLLDNSTNGLWKHIVLGTIIPPDYGHWSTGNGWAAAGMLRVLATMMHTPYNTSFTQEIASLTQWVGEIHTGMYSHLDSTFIFRNYADDNSTFYDASSTALLASTVYRLSVLAGNHSHIPLAEASRKALIAPNTSHSSHNSTQHITSKGLLTPVANPDMPTSQGNQSAEGQAFVLEMQAAWQDWVNAGSLGPISHATRAWSLPVWWHWCAWLLLWWALLD